MPKIPDCDRCRHYAHSHDLVCEIHPVGIDGEVCPDLKLPVTYETDHVQRLTRSQQYQILMTHPMFTGLSPQCRYEYPSDRSHLSDSAMRSPQHLPRKGTETLQFPTLGSSEYFRTGYVDFTE